jgi:imidazolonepropionase-like amidohydrolase
MERRFSIACALVLLWVPLAGGADEAARLAAITGVSIIDVEAGAVLPDRTVLIEGETVMSVGPAAGTAPPAGARLVDGRGLFLIPGLIDSHIHCIDPETFGPLLVANGVVLARDMGNDTDSALELRDRWNRSSGSVPELLATGAIVDGRPPYWPFSEVCETPEEGRRAVEKLAGRKVDAIKVYGRLKKEVHAAVVDEAHRRGLKAIGHVPEAMTPEEALGAGQDSIEHLTGLERLLEPDRLAGDERRALIGKVRSAGIPVCPTVTVFERIARLREPALREDPLLAYVPEPIIAFWRSMQYGDDDYRAKLKASLPLRRALVRELHAAGVPILAGTDLANPYLVAGFSLHEELENLVASGLSPLEALRSATSAPARILGVDSKLGSVGAGKRASLVLLEADPLADIGAVRRIAGVFLRGRHYPRAELDRLLEEVRGRVSASRPAAPAEGLALPGKVIARGRFRMLFNGMDYGHEDFLITETEDGYHLAADVRPKAFQPASRSVIHAGKDFAVRSAEWRQESKAPVTASYRVDAGKATAEAREGDRIPERQSIDFPAGAILGSPAAAGRARSSPWRSGCRAGGS